MSAHDLMALIDDISVYRSGERRAPHKPLLLLIAFAHALRGEHDLSFDEVSEQLTPLLRSFAPPVKARHQPELPYWHLQSDGLWVVDHAEELPRQKGGFPRMAGLRETRGHLPRPIFDALKSDPTLVERATHAILEAHFPPSLHEDILETVGLPALDTPALAAEAMPDVTARRRDPNFRRSVLRAYEHRCAVTGFRAALGGTYFGCEAAHVQWHARGGPDVVSNGIALEPTLHKLFDAGAWTLTDDHRVLVSEEFTGSDTAVSRLRDLHGQSLRAPLAGSPRPSRDFIRWHRESALGGVFRAPALPL